MVPTDFGVQFDLGVRDTYTLIHLHTTPTTIYYPYIYGCTNSCTKYEYFPGTWYQVKTCLLPLTCLLPVQ